MCKYLSGPFSGWSIRGNYLVSPDGDRMTPERIAGQVAPYSWGHHVSTGRKRVRSTSAVTIRGTCLWGALPR